MPTLLMIDGSLGKFEGSFSDDNLSSTIFVASFYHFRQQEINRLMSVLCLVEVNSTTIRSVTVSIQSLCDEKRAIAGVMSLQLLPHSQLQIVFQFPESIRIDATQFSII